MKDRKTNVMIIVGTRPEAIKMIPVIQKFQEREDLFDLTLVNAAQHREMVDQIFSIHKILPDIDLDLMEDNQSLTSIFTKGAKALEKVFLTQRPDVLLIQGDTSTVFVGALIAFYYRVDVAHVEAGLRTFDIYNPFPEEVNRRITSVISKIHFAPTEWAKKNLLKEGYPEESIYVTGNPVIDSLFKTLKIEYQFKEEPLSTLDFSIYKVILVTAHRRENHGKPLINICNAILKLIEIYKDLLFIYPVHPNPDVERVVKDILGGKDRIFLIKPLDYLSFVHLMKKSYFILSDSGGIQEEAPSLGKPVLVLRKFTERPEAFDAGAIKIIGTDYQRIIDEVSFLLENKDEYSKMVISKNPYGDGKAGERIVDIIASHYC